MKLKIPDLNLKNFLTSAILAGILGIFSFLIVAHYTTTSPNYCLKECHAKGDTFNIGTPSKVHPSFNKVKCIDCHSYYREVALLQFVKDGYQGGYNARDKTINENCVDCHKNVLKDEILFKYNVYRIRIPHKKHLEKSRCTTCHKNIAHDKELKKTNRPKMQICFKCHQGEKKNCYLCHPVDSIKLPLTNIIKKEECISCHISFKGFVYKIYNINFSHTGHLKKEIKCEKCHSNKVKHGKIISKEECNVCHGIPLPHQKDWKNIHKYYTKKDICLKCHNKNLCLICHLKEKPSSHKINWKKNHPKFYLKKISVCQTCHNSSFCFSCHKVQMPHPYRWLRVKHKATALKNKSLCKNCHSKNFCFSCHKVQMPHLENWKQIHFEKAKENKNICKNCHSENFCLSCHLKNKPSSHNETWKKMHTEEGKKNPQKCANCHKENACINCHKVEMPHLDDWVGVHKETVTQKGKEVCLKCHNEDFCATCH